MKYLLGCLLIFSGFIVFIKQLDQTDGVILMSIGYLIIVTE